MKEEAESAIMKENIARFKLSYLSPLLEGYSWNELGILGEGNLVEDVLKNCTMLENHLENKEVIQIFKNGW